jgi:hypothetical protein
MNPKGGRNSTTAAAHHQRSLRSSSQVFQNYLHFVEECTLSPGGTLSVPYPPISQKILFGVDNKSFQKHFRNLHDKNLDFF